MRHIDFVIDESCRGIKISAYLRSRAGFSSRLTASLKRVPDGITLNGAQARTIDPLTPGDVLSVNIPDRQSGIEPLPLPLDLAYADDDVLVINKPAGLAMHPTHNHQGDTLANAVTAYLAGSGNGGEFHAVGRLDKCTSGLVICALNRHAAARLNGNYEKTYYAIAGAPLRGSGVIDLPIARPDPMKTLRCVREDGLPSVTRWTALSGDGISTLVKVIPETGRTHQIRVHFAASGAPLAGDDMYGSEDKRIGRAALHCGELRFRQPVTGDIIELTAPLPEDMAAITAGMRPVTDDTEELQ